MARIESTIRSTSIFSRTLRRVRSRQLGASPQLQGGHEYAAGRRSRSIRPPARGGAPHVLLNALVGLQPELVTDGTSRLHEPRLTITPGRTQAPAATISRTVPAMQPRRRKLLVTDHSPKVTRRTWDCLTAMPQSPRLRRPSRSCIAKLVGPPPFIDVVRLRRHHDPEVVGESHHQDALWRVVGGRTADRVRIDVHAVPRAGLVTPTTRTPSLCGSTAQGRAPVLRRRRGLPARGTPAPGPSPGFDRPRRSSRQ